MNVHYTEHGYGYPAPAGEPDEPPPSMVARCSGPAGCDKCAEEASWGYGQDGGAGYLKPTPEQLEALHRDDVR